MWSSLSNAESIPILYVRDFFCRSTGISIEALMALNLLTATRHSTRQTDIEEVLKKPRTNYKELDLTFWKSLNPFVTYCY